MDYGADWAGELAERPTDTWPALTAEAARVLAARRGTIREALREAALAPLAPMQQRRARFLRWLVEHGRLSDWPDA